MLPDCTGEQNRIIDLLRQCTGATVARINYRASSSHPYPTPCHDTLAGWDWIRENLLRHDLDSPSPARLAVCGELVGASLATMLALTECRLGQTRIAAAAVNNPITDWVFPDDLPSVTPSELPEPMAPDETSLPADEDLADSLAVHAAEEEQSKPARKPQKRAPKQPSPTAWQAQGTNAVLPSLTLSGERHVLFRRPDDYFDRFASPAHFFRSPYAQLVFPESDHVSASRDPDELLDMESQMHLSHFASLDEDKTPAAAPLVPTLTRCRAYARIYPPAGTTLTLPAWNITTGSQSPLSDQATELARVLKRSIARHMLRSLAGRTRWFDATEKEQYEHRAQQRIQTNVSQGLGLWTQQHDNLDWKSDVEKVAAWIKAHLKPDSFGI